MPSTLEYIVNKFSLDLSHRNPIFIEQIGREKLAMLFNELGFTSGAEIGVEQGRYSEVLCRANPDARIFLIDAWTAYSGYRDHVNQDKLDGFYEATRKRVAQYPNVEIIKGFSMEVVKVIPDQSLDFVYIDSNHEFQHVTNDIAEWGKKVRKGGIIAGHDYANWKGKNPQIQVKQVVDGWTAAYSISPWFIVNDRETIDGKEHKIARSWFWVK